MPSQDPHAFLQTLITKEFQAHPHATPADGRTQAREPLVITLSRDHGALGEEVAQRLSQCLGIGVFDREILTRVAQRARIDVSRFEGHDEQTSAALTSFLYGLVSGKAGTLQDYRRHLGEVVAELAQTDGVIIGRGAHLILRTRKVFRVRVVGSLRNCAQRLADQLGIAPAQAERMVLDTNEKRHQSVIDLYGQSVAQCSLEHAQNFDLVINTDRTTVDGAVSVILLAMQEAGFALQLPRREA